MGKIFPTLRNRKKRTLDLLDLVSRASKRFALTVTLIFHTLEVEKSKNVLGSSSSRVRYGKRSQRKLSENFRRIRSKEGFDNEIYTNVLVVIRASENRAL